MDDNPNFDEITENDTPQIAFRLDSISIYFNSNRYVCELVGRQSGIENSELESKSSNDISCLSKILG
jgi:hypothetical protein